MDCVAQGDARRVALPLQLQTVATPDGRSPVSTPSLKNTSLSISLLAVVTIAMLALPATAEAQRRGPSRGHGRSFVVVSGMWGMNFDNIPLAHSSHGFWTMLVLQLGLGAILLIFLRWRKLL